MGTVIRFADFALDVAAYELRRGGVRVEIGRREMDLLILLVRHRGCLVERAELGLVVWGDKQPADLNALNANINTVVRRLRDVLGDDASNPAFIETASGKGYRFVCPVSPDATPTTNPSISDTPSQTIRPEWMVTLRSAIPGVAIIVASLILAAALTFDVYGLAIALFVVLASLLAVVNRDGFTTPGRRAFAAIFLLGGGSYTLSAWNLSAVVDSVVNMRTLRPAFLYPFVTGLRYVPSFVVVLGYWVAFATRSEVGLAGNRFYQRTYWGLISTFLLLTSAAVAVGYGDENLWAAGVPQAAAIVSAYALVFALNVGIAAVAFRHYNQPRIHSYGALFSSCALAFAALCVPAVVIEHLYDVVNHTRLDLRRTTAYVAQNPDALIGYRQQLAAAPRPEAGPDFVALVNDRGFERALREQRFYRQNFDEPFQMLRRSVILAYESSQPETEAGSPSFVLVRVPNRLAEALRFQPAPP